MGLEKCIQDRYNSPSTKAPTGNISCILGPYCTQMLGHPLTTSPTYMAWMRSLPELSFSSGH
jgi:hypothetical protein